MFSAVCFVDVSSCQVAWDALQQRVIEEKLEKLGVERGTGGSVSIHAPHARAASVSASLN